MASKVITQMQQVAATEQINERLARIEKALKIAEPDADEAPVIYTADADIRAGQKVTVMGANRLQPIPDETPGDPEAKPEAEAAERRRPAQPHRTPGK